MAPQSAPRTARDRARAELTREITTTAKAHLAEHGAPGLSLRAISRDLGMVSSALYRYFPSRDALLTALIIEAYDALGAACEAAEAAVGRHDLLGRWRAVAHATRGWARAHPHEYALIYGTPVPGYAAPTDTIDPAGRVALLLLALIVDMDLAGIPAPTTSLPVGDSLAAQLDNLTATVDIEVDPDRLLQGIGGWVLTFGMINFELFGTFNNVFDDADELHAYQVDLMASHLGLIQ